MSDNITILDVTPRTVIGKQVNALRMQGLIPGVIYGPSSEKPLNFQVAWATLRPILRKVGSTELIGLRLEGTTINTLVREVQRDPVRGDVLHIDLYAVDMNAITRTSVPITVHGLEAANKRVGTRVYQLLTIVEVESLPNKIPQHIDVDLSQINRPGDHISVKDLPAIDGVAYLTDDDTIVVQAAVHGDAEEDLDGEVTMGEVEVIGRGKDKEDAEDF
jgi:large subunit ribosomal protein L25